MYEVMGGCHSHKNTFSALTLQKKIDTMGTSTTCVNPLSDKLFQALPVLMNAAVQRMSADISEAHFLCGDPSLV